VRTLLPFILAAMIGLLGCSGSSTTEEPRADEARHDEPGADEPPGEEPGAGEVEEARPAVPPLHPSVDDYPEARVMVLREEGRILSLPVKVADTPERRQHGLMEVPELPDGTGMLFLFEEDHQGGFWMKDTLVPLDIAFVDAVDEVVAILSMEPCEADPCEVYEPGTTYRAALEVPQGWFESNDVEVGDHLRYELDDDG
jgi:uncharacterized protein